MNADERGGHAPHAFVVLRAAGHFQTVTNSDLRLQTSDFEHEQIVLSELEKAEAGMTYTSLIFNNDTVAMTIRHPWHARQPHPLPTI
jgi:hypothetical protein